MSKLRRERKKQRKAAAAAAAQEEAIYSALGIPKNWRAGLNYPFSVGTPIPTQNIPVGGRTSGSVAVQNVHVDKQALYAALYGRHPAAISVYTMGGRFSNGVVFADPPLKARSAAGYELACTVCRYVTDCLRDKWPRVCTHCRAALTQHTLKQHRLAIKGFGKHNEVETAYWRFQHACTRVSAACPLFVHGAHVCMYCQKQATQPYITRVRILWPTRTETIGVRGTPRPQRTFRQYLAQHQKARGDLHDRQRTRHASRRS